MRYFAVIESQLSFIEFIMHMHATSKSYAVEFSLDDIRVEFRTGRPDDYVWEIIDMKTVARYMFGSIQIIEVDSKQLPTYFSYIATVLVDNMKGSVQQAMDGEWNATIIHEDEFVSKEIASGGIELSSEKMKYVTAAEEVGIEISKRRAEKSSDEDTKYTKFELNEEILRGIKGRKK